MVQGTRRKRLEEYVEQPVQLRRREVDMEVAPIKFSGTKENCVKKALFLGDQYMGENGVAANQEQAKGVARVQEGSRSRSHSKTPLKEARSRPSSGKKTKASTKIIDILTAKKLKDEMSGAVSPSEAVTSPRQGRRRHSGRLSEYVADKLRLDRSSKSRSGTPSSPQRARRSGCFR
jgi:hypothetical protein